MAPQESLLFADERDQHDKVLPPQPWKILIVDDEKDVHESTTLAIGRELICDRPLNFLHAFTAAEAKRVLCDEAHIAVVLLDVVMESEDAGLQLVHFIREELGLSDTRIILRTGQPGYAPELNTISQYDINDYKSKSDLTRIKLYTALTSAIRAYSQIRALNASRRSHAAIVRASKELLCQRNYNDFASKVITQLAHLLQLPEDGIACIKHGNADLSQRADLLIMGSTGNFRRYSCKPLTSLSDDHVTEWVFEAARTRQHLFTEEATCLYFSSPGNAELVVFLAAGLKINGDIRDLLDLFATNIAACIDNVRLLEQRHEYAFLDQLLNIPNRLSFLKALERQLANSDRNQQVVLIDIDQFGALNDTIGSQNGDRLLKQIASRLQHTFNEHIVARISGDTFGLLGDTDKLSPEAVSHVFSHPFEIAKSPHLLSATQGRVLLGSQTHAAEVIAQANVALKRAKQTLRGGFQDFHQDMLAETENRVQMLQGLRAAFENRRLFMVYQPKIMLDTGRVCGFEALMRWRNAHGEFVSPMDFIPVAESSGLIVPLGEWALRESLSRINALRAQSGMALHVAVNVSMVQFAHPDFLNMLDSALQDCGADPESLDLEITESFAMHDQTTVQTLVKAIHDRGIRISIDDFGTGFSSLSYLESLNVHSLKIDKSFVDRIATPQPDTRICEMILRLGQALQLSVVAEGIETPEQMKWLQAQGCDLGQGYHFARPLTHEQLDDWFDAHRQETGDTESGS